MHDVSGAAIADAKIHISGPVTKQTVSDAQGAFSFPNVPVGVYRIDVNKPGYALATSDVLVFAGESTPVTASLQHLSLNSLHTIATV
ncbi:MAG: carboxypeptidase-like regulatory domain-containing protein, partial [Vulcanimicrobiaceae bacterium]